MQTTFLSGTNVCDCHNMQINFWFGTKKFGPVQNILRPVKGQGISCIPTHNFTKNFHKFFEQSIESVLQFTL